LCMFPVLFAQPGFNVRRILRVLKSYFCLVDVFLYHLAEDAMYYPPPPLFSPIATKTLKLKALPASPLFRVRSKARVFPPTYIFPLLLPLFFLRTRGMVAPDGRPNIPTLGIGCHGPPSPFRIVLLEQAVNKSVSSLFLCLLVLFNTPRGNLRKLCVT